MARSRAAAEYQSAEHRARVSRGLLAYHRRRRELARVMPADLVAAERGGGVRPELRPLLGTAAMELEAWLAALGGADTVSPQRRALLESAARLGVAERAVTLRLLQTGDPELGSRLATIAGGRRALLASAGLDELKQELTIGEYIASKRAEAAQEPATAPIAPDDDPAAEDTEEGPAAPSGGAGDAT